MSAEMRDFAAAFSKGLDRGVGMAQKGQDQAIQREHNKLLRDQHEATERHNTRRDDIYAQAVTQAGETARMRAQAALNKGSGRAAAAPAPAPASSGIDDLEQGAAGIGVTIPKPPATQPINVNVMGGSGTTEAPDAPIPTPPAVMRKGGMVKARKGGMIRKFADGGMSVAEALSYGPKGGGYEKPEPKGAASTAGSSFDKAYTAAQKNKPDGTIKNAAPKVTATGPVGSGPAGSYTTDDVRPGGVLDTTSAGISGTDYRVRRGGMIKKFAGGGAADLSDPEAAVKSMAYTPADKNPDGSNKTKDQDSGTIASTARAVSSGGNFDFSGLPSSGGTGGSEGSTGIGGAADDGSGGSAAAGTSGGPGDGAGGGDAGSGTYRRGGRVRRFQSGGRVMEAAIDTGTSGPGSGYGYRAAPPSRGY